MKSRERIDKALSFIETDRPPHFENHFGLTEEAFGLSFPTHGELQRASIKEREMLYGRMAELYARIIEKYRWDAVALWTPGSRDELQYDFIPFLQKYLGGDFPIINHVWSSFVDLETVKDYTEFSIKMFEEPEEIHAWARKMLEEARLHAQRSIDAGVYGIIIASDSAFNSGSFLPPDKYAEFSAPYAKELIGLIQSQGVKAGYHTDGNIMGILDTIIGMKPDYLHSIDPMAGMDIKVVKERTYGKVALMGNVQCNYLQDGPDEDIKKSAGYCLDHGPAGGGYIFSTSNVVFKGLPLRSYEVMLDYFWNRYPAAE